MAGPGIFKQDSKPSPVDIKPAADERKPVSERVAEVASVTHHAAEQFEKMAAHPSATADKKEIYTKNKDVLNTAHQEAAKGMDILAKKEKELREAQIAAPSSSAPTMGNK